MVDASTTMRAIRLRGRTEELRRLTALLADAAAGHGAALVLTGEAGVGRTALLTEVERQARSRGFTVLSTQGSEDERVVPFAGLQRLLHPVLDHAPTLPPAQAEALRRAVEDGSCAEGDRLRLGLAVLGLLRGVTRERPVLCCADDAHRLDPDSTRVLGFVARRLGGERIALLLAHRDDEPVGEPVPGIPTLRLTGLDLRASQELLADRVPGGLTGDVAVVLATLASGNPRALVELATALTPAQRRGEAPPPVTLPVDSALRATYLARLTCLPEATRWLLLLAAADEELEVEELIAAGEASGVGVDELEPAESAGLVRVEHRRVVIPHRLLRSVIYHESTLTRRRAAHLALARVLDPVRHRLRHLVHRAAAASTPDDELARELRRAAETGPPAVASLALERAAELSTEPDTVATDLLGAAHHAWRAGQAWRARLLLRRAEQQGSSASVRECAQALAGEIELRTGVTVNARNILLDAAAALAGRDRRLAVCALLLAGEALCLSGDHVNYTDVARQALALQRDGEPPDMELVFAYFTGLAAMFRGRPDEAVGPLRTVLTLAGRLDDTTVLLRASLAAILLGDDHAARRLAERAIAVARAHDDAVSVPQALELAAYADLALGRHDSALTAALDGLELARATGQEGLAAQHLGVLAVLAALAGDRQSCLLRVREIEAITGTGGASQPRAFGRWACALLDLADGQPRSALTRLRGLLYAGSSKGDLVLRVVVAPHLVEAAAGCGDRATGDAALKAFDIWTRGTGDRAWLALAARCHALLASEPEEVEAHFREALRQHRSDAPDFARARTELLFGRYLRRMRQPGAAREYLQGALETFQQLDLPSWAEQASAELRAAGGRAGPRPTLGADVLTPQQERIARLVAQGATNREIAAKLLVSTRTVDYHLRNVFAALGVRSRTELARLMG